MRTNLCFRSRNRFKGSRHKQLVYPFYQGNNSRPGTGIGLSYSKILAEQHGGSIGAYDHQEFPGATFWFEIPRNIQSGEITLQPHPYLNELLAPTQEVESIPDADDNQENTKEHTLLIVDDNVDLTDYLHNTLKTNSRRYGWLSMVKKPCKPAGNTSPTLW